MGRAQFITVSQGFLFLNFSFHSECVEFPDEYEYSYQSKESSDLQDALESPTFYEYIQQHEKDAEYDDKYIENVPIISEVYES